MLLVSIGVYKQTLLTSGAKNIRWLTSLPLNLYSLSQSHQCDVNYKIKKIYIEEFLEERQKYEEFISVTMTIQYFECQTMFQSQIVILSTFELWLKFQGICGLPLKWRNNFI